MNCHSDQPTRRTRLSALFLLLIVASLALAAAGAARAADSQSKRDPASIPTPPTPPSIDPVTGLPLSPPPPWKDPAWPEPNRVLPDVVFDAIPLGQVTLHLRQEFKDSFDVLIPNAWQDPNNPAVTLDPLSTTVKMQLKNVTASEVFNAMNLMFEVENTPYRWELMLNGNRPTAMLRVLPRLLPPTAPPPPPPPQARLVYFVGDLLGEEKPGGMGMTMQQLVKTVSEVYAMSYGPATGVVQFHKEAQLLIVTGTGDQIQFVQQTLSALREKARVQEAPPTQASEPKAKTEERGGGQKTH